MNIDIFIDYIKVYKIYIIVVLFSVLFSIFIFYPKQEEIIVSNESVKVYDEPKESVSETFEDEEYKKEMVKTVEKEVFPIGKEVIKPVEIAEYKEPLKEKITLYSTYDKSGQYLIKIESSKSEIKEDKINNGEVNYTLMSGDIENDHNTTTFALSLDKSYIVDENNLMIRIKDVSKAKSEYLNCDGYFLNGLNKDNAYHIKIDFFDEYVSCFIQSENESRQVEVSQKREFLTKQDIISGNKGVALKAEMTDDLQSSGIFSIFSNSKNNQ